MNLQEEIKIMKERIAELEELVKKENEFPQDGDEYFVLTGSGSVVEYIWTDDNVDSKTQAIGNIFRTEEEAEFAVEKLKVEAELRKYSRPYEYGKFNYYLFLNIESDSLDTQFTSYCPPQGAIYFESEEKVQQAVSNVGADRIKKYLFGVEEL